MFVLDLVPYRVLSVLPVLEELVCGLSDIAVQITVENQNQDYQDKHHSIQDYQKNVAPIILPFGLCNHPNRLETGQCIENLVKKKKSNELLVISQSNTVV